MTRVRVDPSLPLPEAPPDPDRIGGAEGQLVLADQARRGTFLIEGDGIAVTGPERGDPHTVTIGGRVRAAQIEPGVGVPVNLVATPGVLRRERIGPAGSTLETLLAAPTIPLVALQWGAPPGAPAPAVRDLRFTLVPDAASARYRIGPAGVCAVDDSCPDDVTVAVLSPPPAAWRVQEAPSGGVAVAARIDTGGSLTLLLSAGAESRVRTALAGGSHLSAHERAAQGGGSDAGIVVASGVPEIDAAVGWARARLRASLAHADPGPPRAGNLLWSALGSVAVGDAETALAALSVLERMAEAAPHRTAVSPEFPEGPLASLVAARIGLGLGDATPARRHARALDPARIEEVRAGSDEATWALWSLSLELLADSLRLGDSESEIQRLRDAAGLRHPSARGHVRLPVVGTSSASAPSGTAALLRVLLGRPRAAPVPTSLLPEGSPGASALRAWQLLTGGEAGPGYALWRSEISAGLRGSLGPRATWDGPDGPRILGSPGAGALLGALVHGLLGLTPDAPAGRVELSPAFPSHVRSFDVTNLVAGSCRFGLSYRRDGPVSRYVVEPTYARVPVSLVLSPTVPAGSIRAIRVDGVEAELDARPHGSGTRVQVQIALDGRRTLEIEGLRPPADQSAAV